MVQKGPSKSAAEVRKRIIVGFMILSWYVSPMYIHPLAISFVTCKFVFIVNREVFELESKERYYLSAERCKNGAFRYAFQCALFYFAMPRWGILERGIVERSGYTAEEYPVLFSLLYENNMQNSIVILSSFFLLCLCQWRDRNLKY